MHLQISLEISGSFTIFIEKKCLIVNIARFLHFWYSKSFISLNSTQLFCPLVSFNLVSNAHSMPPWTVLQFWFFTLLVEFSCYASWTNCRHIYSQNWFSNCFFHGLSFFYIHTKTLCTWLWWYNSPAQSLSPFLF